MAEICFIRFIYFLIFLSHIPRSWSESRTINLRTKQGQIVGFTELLQQTEFTLFLGIPYAHSPTGAFRFKEPFEQNQWTSTNFWNATFYRNFCVGSNDIIMNKFSPQPSHETQIGEDCLYINLYIPRNLSKLDVDINTLELPIIIYFSSWENDPYIHDAWRLVTSKEAIIAQVNYRTGVFGFFSNLNSEAPGNLGLLDQSKAIKWLWDNINGFGGDSKRITLMGFGLASGHIGLHAISSSSHVLFKRIICHGPVYLQPDFIDRNPILHMQELAKVLNCESSNYSRIVNCLRNIPYDTLHEVSSRFAWKPIIDGVFLTQPPYEMMKGRMVNQVNYIIGLDQHAGYHLLGDKLLDCQDLRDLFRIIDESITKHFVNNVEKIKYFLKGEYAPCSYNVTSLLKVCSDFLNDYHYYFPANTFAEYLVENSAQNTYMYELEYIPTHSVSSFESLLFGDKEIMSPSEKSISHFIKRAFVMFSQYGDMSKLKDGKAWRPYSLLDHNHMVIGPVIQFQTSWSPAQKRRIHLWNDYIKQLDNSNECFVTGDCMAISWPLRNGNDFWNTAFIVISSLCLLLIIVILVLCCRLSRKCHPTMCAEQNVCTMVSVPIANSLEHIRYNIEKISREYIQRMK